MKEGFPFQPTPFILFQAFVSQCINTEETNLSNMFSHSELEMWSDKYRQQI